MVYLITDSGVKSAPDFKKLNNKYHVLVEPGECKCVGPDYVVCMSNKDLEFVQDKARVSNIMFGNFFRKDNSVKVFVIINLVLTALSIFVK